MVSPLVGRSGSSTHVFLSISSISSQKAVKASIAAEAWVSTLSSEPYKKMKQAWNTHIPRHGISCFLHIITMETAKWIKSDIYK